jgi:sugar phosphate isomerase/epimerase
MTRYPIAYQLYSSRNFPPLEAQLPELKAMGYDAIEPWLPAYEAGPKAFRRALDVAGLACYGFHMPLSGLTDEPDRYIDIALTLGARYMIPPFIAEDDRRPTVSFWKGLGGKLSQGAEAAAPHGLKVLWHNHAFEYVEIDCGWATQGGADIVAELTRYAGRILVIQTKDPAPAGIVAEDGWAATGDGIINWAALAPLIRATAAHHLCTEHDNPADWRRFAKRSINHLRAIGL